MRGRVGGVGVDEAASARAMAVSSMRGMSAGSCCPSSSSVTIQSPPGGRHAGQRRSVLAEVAAQPDGAHDRMFLGQPAQTAADAVGSVVEDQQHLADLEVVAVGGPGVLAERGQLLDEVGEGAFALVDGNGDRDGVGHRCKPFRRGTSGTVPEALGPPPGHGGGAAARGRRAVAPTRCPRTRDHPGSRSAAPICPGKAFFTTWWNARFWAACSRASARLHDVVLRRNVAKAVGSARSRRVAGPGRTCPRRSGTAARRTRVPPPSSHSARMSTELGSPKMLVPTRTDRRTASGPETGPFSLPGRGRGRRSVRARPRCRAGWPRAPHRGARPAPPPGSTGTRRTAGRRHRPA